MMTPASVRKPIEEAIIAGLGKAVTRNPRVEVLKTWRELLTGELSWDAFHARTMVERKLTYLTVDTTAACDLTCPGMCYYHPDIKVNVRQMSEPRLFEAIGTAFSELDLRDLIVVGKEPFLNPQRLFAILDFAAGVKTQGARVGLVTNGRNVALHTRDLQVRSEAGSLDFMDFSIDSGYEVEHDAIRGVPGTFAKAFSALSACAESLASTRVGVTSVIRQKNQAGLIELLRRGYAASIRNFCFVPIQPPPFTITPAVQAIDLVSFFAEVWRILENELAGAGLEVLASLNGLTLLECVQRGFLKWEDLEEDEFGQIYATRQIAGNTLIFNFAVIPDYGHRLARITHKGDYLAHAHFLQTPDPSAFAAGNIESEAIEVLHHRAKQEYFLQIIQSRKHHACSDKPCWGNCFGGWTIAEHSLLNGQTLIEKPRLCGKTASDFRMLEGKAG
jgi:MoaA/NifB/PqqE/SkfB family radical SAM enzyme